MAGYKLTRQKVERLRKYNISLEEKLDIAAEAGNIPEAKRLRGLIVENERMIEELWEDCTWQEQ